MNPTLRTGDERRARLARARVQLLFTPEVCGASSESPGDELAERALARLAAALPFVDVVQVRPKPTALVTAAISSSGPPGPTAAVSSARLVRDWTRRVLALVGRLTPRLVDPPLVLVNDRVDVALLLAPACCDGAHVGADDTPPEVAREFLGPDLVIGRSTHAPGEVLGLEERGCDYVGFGPIFPTATKGYARGLGSPAAWIAREAASLPLFAIGGIDLTNADQLAEVGRVAVSSAILAAADPARAARELRALLEA